MRAVAGVREQVLGVEESLCLGSGLTPTRADLHNSALGLSNLARNAILGRYTGGPISGQGTEFTATGNDDRSLKDDLVQH